MGRRGGREEEGKGEMRSGKRGMGEGEDVVHLRNGLLFCCFDLRSGSVEDLQQSSCSGSHTRVKICLGTLDVIVQVVAECVNEVHSLVPCSLVFEGAREQHCRK